VSLCPLCGGAVRKGQYFVVVRPYVTISNAYQQLVSEPVVMEDGSSAKYAHYGCVLKRCPELIGALNGEMRT
jgi:hypothetical protein